MEKAKAYIKNEWRGGSVPLEPPMSSQNLNSRTMITNSTAVCYVCGTYGHYNTTYSVRIKPNPDRPNESYFPFLEKHEPPTGILPVSPNQQTVGVCGLCYTLLNEQWNSFERSGKPYSQRIYHLKRVDGKAFIGADMSKQGEYAAQMLGMSAEHLASSGISSSQTPQNSYPYTRSDSAQHQRPTSRDQQMYMYQQQQHLYTMQQQQQQQQQQQMVARNESPIRTSSRNESPQNKSDNFFSKRPNDSHVNSNTNSNNQSSARPSSRSEKIPTPNSSSRPQSREIPTPPTTSTPSRSVAYSPFAQHKLKLGTYMNSATSTPPAIASSSDQNNYQTNSNNKTGAASTYLYPSQNEMHRPDGESEVLDLRNTTSDVGILDLSMPDKNSITQVCYVCGDEYRRGSLIELSTVEPKDANDRDKPFFPIFGETHPRPARSRPKDPKGFIQACKPCFHHLIQQWQNYQTIGTPEADRRYTLRKRPASVAERATFVCYTCGVDTISSLLRLVYCCPNAEREPYYPFIKSMQPFPNASPISPQGMVQLCSSCNEKHSHLAEGGSTAANTSIDGRFTPSDNKSQANSESSNVRFKPFL